MVPQSTVVSGVVNDEGGVKMKTIYVLVHDRTIRYVGCTGDLKTRARLHWSCRFSKNTQVALWLRTLSEPPQCHSLQEVSDDVAYDAETYWIELLRQVPSVNLLNTSVKRSGQGRPRGYIHTAETRAKISAVRRGRGYSRTPGHAKLSDDQVRAIRLDIRSRREIAADYDVTVSLIGKIQRGVARQHVV